MLLGEVASLRATPRDAAGNPLFSVSLAWSSAATGIATVDGTGIVTATGVGSTAITAAVGDHAAHTNVSVTSVTFATVTAGGAHSCALSSSGGTWCWGRAEMSQLGPTKPNNVCLVDEDTHANLPCLAHPVLVTGAPTFTQIVAAERSTCALTSDGSAYCWGWNNVGQLGDGTSTGLFSAVRAAPAAVATTVKFAMLSGSGMTYCGVSTAGAGYCWGNGASGQLGNGQTNASGAPVAVGGSLTFKSITVGNGFACGITTADDAWCWGSNTFGQLGTGQVDTGPHSSPLLVSGGRKWSRIDGSFGFHVCAVDVAGAAYCWGANTTGQLGDGTLIDRSVPTAASGGLTFSDVVAGGFSNIQEHSCGLTPSGKAYCWGDGAAGALGDGSSITKTAPVAVAGNLTFTRLAAGFRHTCGVTSGNVVYCWGSARTGQVGANGFDPYLVPTKVVGQP
jgi:alpha-tubulin suppressor-like RCC1 family protein